VSCQRELPLLQRAVSSVIIPSISFVIDRRMAAHRDWSLTAD